MGKEQVSKEYCLDFYKQRLHIGDNVIPIMEEVLIAHISGTIKEISTHNGNDYISLVDKNGNEIWDGTFFDANCFSTEERYKKFEERKNIKFFITFFDKDYNLLSYLYLDNESKEDYEIPDRTSLIKLSVKYVFERIGSCTILCIPDIFYLFIKSDFEILKVYDDESDNEVNKLIYNDESHHKCHIQISDDYMQFETYEELKKFIRKLIIYFQNAELGFINKNEVGEYPEFKKFKSDLIKDIRKGFPKIK